MLNARFGSRDEPLHEHCPVGLGKRPAAHVVVDPQPSAQNVILKAI